MAFLDETGLATLWGLTVDKINTKADLEIVSYVGTNTAGENNPTSVTFSNAPDLIVMLGSRSISKGSWRQVYDPDHECYCVLPTSVIPTEYTRGMGFGFERNYYIYGKKSTDGKTFSWCSYDSPKGDGTAEEQYNSSGWEYYVLGLYAGGEGVR